MTENITPVVRRYQDETADMQQVPKGETPNLHLVHYQQRVLVTCNHGLYIFHGLLGSAQVGNTWVPLF